MLPLGPGFIGIGVEAFYLQQVRDDSGAPATLGGFRGRRVGVGRWLPELDTRNRLEGDYFWLKCVHQL